MKKKMKPRNWSKDSSRNYMGQILENEQATEGNKMNKNRRKRDFES